MPRQYSRSFRERMVRRMVGPSAVSANALSVEVGVSQASLSRWLREAGPVAGMTPSTEHGQAPGKRTWTARERFRAVVEAATRSEQDLVGFFPREGLHEAEVGRWREAAEAALGGGSRQAAPAGGGRQAKESAGARAAAEGAVVGRP
jgi:transposase-like protein